MLILLTIFTFALFNYTDSVMEPTTTITFVKGGETALSANKLWQGQQNDENLTKESEVSVGLFAETLQNQHFAAIYSSRLQRVSQVAEAIKKFYPSLTVQTDSNLIQRQIGDFEGKTQSYVMNKYKEATNDQESKNADEIFETKWIEDVETNQDLLERMTTFVQMIQKQHEGQHVLAATHNDNIRLLLRSIKKESISVDYKVMPNATLVLELQEDEWKVKSQNGIFVR